MSIRMLRRWGDIWGKQRLMKNVKLALVGAKHFPVHLILLEILGGIMGVRAYKRSVSNAILVDHRCRQQQTREVAA
jgi:hypothetical protein